MEDIAEEVREQCSVRAGETGAVTAPDLPTTREDADRRTADDPLAGERDHLLRTLEEHRWNRGTASAALGIDRSTLWRKMKRLGIG
jgi:transcriptional regulator of acetoin/glycerol metabolism